MRSEPSVVHLDLDAFFAAVEQRDKPSLRGKPVIVGGLGPRGVVATASYEARTFGVRSAMRMVEARARCPHAAYLSPRFDVYRQASRAVMGVIRDVTPAIETLSLDEAYLDLAAGRALLTTTAVEQVAQELKDRVHAVTGGLTASVGAGTSKLIAKIASDLDKPDGLVVVPPGTERDLLHPMPVTALPGVGPATSERLRRVGVHTVGELDRLGEQELVRLLGQAHGRGLARLAHAEDDRAVDGSGPSKSISVEDTFAQDIADPLRLDLMLVRIAGMTAERLARARHSGRTVTVKVRLFDFTTHTRSATLPGPTDDVHVITRLARRLLAEVDTSAGVRLLGVGVSGLADWVQDDLFGFGTQADGEAADSWYAGGPEPAGTDPVGDRTGGDQTLGAVASSEPAAGTADDEGDARRFVPGADVMHARHGAGWVWGTGLGRVTVRFETGASAQDAGPVRTFAVNDPELGRYTPFHPGIGLTQ